MHCKWVVNRLHAVSIVVREVSVFFIVNAIEYDKTLEVFPVTKANMALVTKKPNKTSAFVRPIAAIDPDLPSNP